MANPTTPGPSPEGRYDGPSEVPPEWRPAIPQPGERPVPREEVGDRYAPATSPGSGVRGRQPSQTMGTLLGDITRTGSWQVAERTTLVMFLGDVKLDLREVLRPGETLDISTYTGMGDVKIVVPAGTRVELQGFTLMGGLRHDVDPAAQGVPETGACVRVNATSLLGDVRVRTMLPDDGSKPPRGWRWTQKR
ncbi:LiaF domain-containing protein [uncultured Serinicoccus sp.]|uniref:LiaF domain-containing protein n=1 Tax=uncultured Serinicoccus sp. TaxID=735514 RepID=UPI00260F15C0|nr:LiaF domain-containing protein [uncultured Serinicoccus sp.]